jgi:two-component system, NtrC family, sensor kinase
MRVLAAEDNPVQQSQRLEAIGRLAPGIAHEINTPMQFIGDNVCFLGEVLNSVKPVIARFMAMKQLLRSGASPALLADEIEAMITDADLEYLIDEFPRAVEQSLEGVRRVSNIVRAMKDFSGPASDQKVPVDINAAIETTVTLARNEWKYVADVITDFDPNLPVVVCLAGEFNQVILSLLLNAAHAIADVMGDGSQPKGQIAVSTRRQENMAEIRISDTGSGIPEDLAIAYNVVAQHNGKIGFETELGKGTTFIVQLPLDETP